MDETAEVLKILFQNKEVKTPIDTPKKCFQELSTRCDFPQNATHPFRKARFALRGISYIKESVYKMFSLPAFQIAGL